MLLPAVPRCQRSHAAAPAPGGPATTLYISGGGYGHGIGMSQYGAYGYALHGWTYQRILGHYYTGTALGTTEPARRAGPARQRVGGVRGRD